MTNDDLIDIVLEKSPLYLDTIIRNIQVLEAMRKIDRIKFLPPPTKKFAYEDIPLPIGYNQTCSQPSMVAFMLDKLKIKEGNKILEIGAGCGYAASIASILCGENGYVYAYEMISELAEIMGKNIASISFIKNIAVLKGDGSLGYPKYAPFDRIFISAGVASYNFNEKIILSQLTDDGILLYPESYGNMFVIKKNKNEIQKDTYYGVSFVPLKGKNA